MSAPDPIPLWKANLRRSQGRDGEPQLVACLENVALILANDAAYQGRFARNELTSETELTRGLPAIVGLLPPRLGPVDDYVLSYTRAALSSTHRLQVGAELASQGLEAAARQRCYNPLQDHLRALTWDGVCRLPTWLSRYLGAEQSEYTAAVGRWWLVSAMARAFRAGCKADHIVVLEGAQGVGKSTAIGILGGPWYLAKLPPLRDYDKAAHALAGAWLVELGEMDAFRGAASSQIKDFLSLSEDRYRPPYGRYQIRQRRTCVFAGTTNDAHYLRDATGARRFWPVATTRLDEPALRADRDQLLAEARVAYEDGAEWWPNPCDEGMLVAVEDQQESRHEGDEWASQIAAWLEAPKGLDDAHGYGDFAAPKDGITTGDVLKGALGVERADWSRDAQTRVGIALRLLGLEVKRKREHGVLVRRYWRRGV